MKKLTKILSLFLLIVSINEVVFSQIPDFLNAPRSSALDERREGCDYLIITPNDAVIKAWADTLRKFREEQGIITHVVTLQEVGTNEPNGLKSYLQNEYENFTPAPAAVLLLGDYNSDPTLGITSFALYDHPDGHQYEPYLADNKLVDFNNDGLPDMVIARMPAANGGEAQRMVQKTLDYELHPYTDEYYYDHAVTAMGYQRTRWFQLCTEIVAGYLENTGKDVIHINGIHQGTPDSIWSTGQRTDLVLNYFGPDGLGYIPSTMSHLTDWSGNASRIKQAIEDGTYLFIHRDHGTFRSWGEPDFFNWDVDALDNDKLTFIMSANCQTGDFSYGADTTDCLAERFLRVPKGAVAIIAASQLSYSYVNDTYVWGFVDYLYPDFLPDYGAQSIDFQYPAFANAYGKYYLHQSNFPYNASMKTITNNLFHYFGDAYLQLYSEVPQPIAITHPEAVLPGTMYITFHADEGTHIALSLGNELIARGRSNGNHVTLHYTNYLYEGDVIKVVATQQNHFRQVSYIRVTHHLDVDDLCQNDVSIYPNPTHDILHIEGVDIDNILIFNVLGQEIKNIADNSDEVVEIDCSDLQNGVYFVKMLGKTDIIRRFIKQ